MTGNSLLSRIALGVVMVALMGFDWRWDWEDRVRRRKAK